MNKIFRVTKVVSPEWGRDSVSLIGYFSTKSEDELRSFVYGEYGRNGYSNYNRENISYSFEEIEIIEI